MRSITQIANGDWQGAPNYQWIGPYWNNAPQNLQKITASQISDGSVQLWAIDDQGTLWSAVQAGRSGAWGSWASGWNGPPGKLKDISAVLSSNGTCALLALDANNQLYQTSPPPPSQQSSWMIMTMPGGTITKIAACRQTSGFRLFGLSNEQLCQYQSSSGWQQPAWPSAPVKFHEIAACSLPDGSSQLFLIDEQHSLWSIVLYSNGNTSQWQGPDWNDASDGCLAVAATGNMRRAQVWIGTADQGLSSASRVSGEDNWSEWDGPNWKLFTPPAPVPRWWSNCMRFSGGSVACGNSAKLDLGNSFTIEGWIQVDTLAGIQIIIHKGYTFCVQEGRIAFPLLPLVASTPLTVNTWHHVAVTGDSSTALVLYLDSVEVGRCPWADPRNFSTATIGRDFHGLIGRLRIWNKAHSPLQIFQDSILWDVSPSQSPSLQAYYDFTLLPPAEISGSDLTFSLTGAVSNCLLIPTLSLPENAYVDVGNNPDLSFGSTKPFTIDGWFLPANTSSGALISKYSSGMLAEYMVHQSNQALRVFNNSLQPEIDSGPYKIQSGAWQHFAVTFDGDQMRLYLNGNLATAADWKAQAAPQIHTLIGAAAGGPSPVDNFQGNIQSIRIWQRALSTLEVQQWMFWDPAEEELIADFDFSIQPPADATTRHPVNLMNGATGAILRQDVDMGWTAPPQARTTRTERPAESAKVTLRPAPQVPTTNAARAATVDLFSADYRSRSLQDFAALVPMETPGRDQLLAEYTSAFDQAIRNYKRDPSLAQPISERRDGNDVVLTHHTPRGDFEILRVPRAAVTDCEIWWARFFYKVIIGFLGALGLPVTSTAIAGKLYNMLTANPRVQAALVQLATTLPSLTPVRVIAAVITFLGVLYQAGFLWTVLKMAFAWKWTILFWLFQKLVLMLEVPGAAAVTLVAQLEYWAFDLTEWVLQYHGACPSSSQVAH
ncbi:MAG TPA: LamG-like jellyroll fold domain-containing protein [Candidatus Angelobacter sp.]|nr:LamG-like jellyroll fold domain-containing protein [Candidatus Angelobacter sp.]